MHALQFNSYTDAQVALNEAGALYPEVAKLRSGLYEARSQSFKTYAGRAAMALCALASAAHPTGLWVRSRTF